MQEGQNKAISWDNFIFDLENLTWQEKYTLEYLFRHFVFTGQPFMRFKQVSKKHLEEGIATTITIKTGKKRGRFCYNKHLNGLIEKGIIERTDYYSKEQGIAKSLRFTREFVRSRSNTSIIRQAEVQKRKRTSNRLCSKTDTTIRKLNLKSEVKIHRLVDSIVDKNYVLNKYIETNTKSLPEGFYVLVENGSKCSSRYSIKGAEQLAARKQKGLFYHKKERHLILGDTRDYVEDKIAEIRLLYKSLLIMIERKDYFPTTISKTNNRLTSFFTVFPNVLLPYIELQKKAIRTWDIANSQFCFLSNIICSYYNYTQGKITLLYRKIEQEKEYLPAISRSFNRLLDENGQLSNSTKKFIKATCNGHLYETVTNVAGITRGEAKKAMFLIAFSKPGYNPPLKKKLKELFPDIIEFIDTFKRIKPNNSENKSCFAVWLQRIEASVCVSEVYNQLIVTKNKFVVLTRHDSFTTNTTERIKFRDTIEKILDKYLLAGYSLRQERHSQ